VPDCLFALAVVITGLSPRPGVLVGTTGRDEERRREATIERLALSPTSVRQHLEMMFDLDIRAALPSIQAPTLVLHRIADPVVPTAAGRYLADHVNGARYVELVGNEHFWFLGDDVDSVLEEMAGLFAVEG
jgi:pimeloyl-ACP methyl ester carboxylesterase